MRPRHLQGLGAFVVALSLALLVPRRAWAREPPDHVSVLTMGPGDHPFTRFGHNALLLEWDREHQQPLVYNFGTFEFDGIKGVEDFMAGRFRYWLSVTSLEATLSSYAAARRSLSAQELELTEDERDRLFRALVDNARPEHRYYDYDYYLDNCSTRVRDAVDGVLAGELGRAVNGPGRLSFRQHSLRLAASDPWLYLGLDLALGAPTDRPTTRWEELFLPQELHDELGHVRRRSGGRLAPLVRAERTLLRAERAPPPRQPPACALGLGAWGSLIGLSLAGLGVSAARSVLGRRAFGIVTALAGAIIGLLGTALCLFWASKHWAAHQNRSLLACPPWALGLFVAGMLFALGHRRGDRALRSLLGASLATTTVLLLLAFGSAARESLRVAALFLPIWAGWFYGARRATAHAIADSPGGTLLVGRAGAAALADTSRSGDGDASRSGNGDASRSGDGDASRSGDGNGRSSGG
jgi:hypothetical protein